MMAGQQLRAAPMRSGSVDWLVGIREIRGLFGPDQDAHLKTALGPLWSSSGTCTRLVQQEFQPLLGI
jgi:hypothetical protein